MVKERKDGWVLSLTAVIPATQEVEIERIEVQGKTPSQSISQAQLSMPVLSAIQIVSRSIIV
jgi:hypothetical protein